MKTQKSISTLLSFATLAIFGVLLSGCDEGNQLLRNEKAKTYKAQRPTYEEERTNRDMNSKDQDLQETQEFRGKIGKITPLHIALKLSDGTMREFMVTSESRVTLEGNPAQLQDLKQGQSATIQASIQEDLLIALSVRATELTRSDEIQTTGGVDNEESNTQKEIRVDGAIISTSNGKLSIIDSDGIEIVFTLADDVKITIDDEEVAFEDLVEGQFVIVSAIVGADIPVATKIGAKRRM